MTTTKLTPDNGPHIHSYANLCGAFHQPQFFRDGQLLWSGASHEFHQDAANELAHFVKTNPSFPVPSVLPSR